MDLHHALGHDPNKEELLKGSLAGLRVALLEDVQRLGPNPLDQLAFAGGLIAHVHEQQKVFRALLGRRSGQFVQDRFRELLVDMVEQEWPEGTKPSWQAHATANYLGGALFQLLTWWLAANRPHPPQEIETLFHALSKPMLQTAKHMK